MTQQYGKRNINDPAGISTVAATSQLTAADVGKTVYVDSTAAAVVTTLPRSAEAGAGAEITVVALTGATNNSTVAIIATGTPDVLAVPAGAPANPAVTNNASVVLRADGVLTWNVVAGLA